jgi:hypothetical protein
MSNSTLFPVTSIEATHFTEALAAASAPGVPPFVGSAVYNIPGVPAIGSRRFLIRSIRITTKENFGPGISFFSRAAGMNADPALDCFVGRWAFLAVNGEQVAGIGLWRYYIDGLAIPYFDLDNAALPGPSFLHAMLENTDVIPKSAGAAGNVVVTVYMEPVQSW